MKTRKAVLSTAVASVLALGGASQGALGEVATEISKPAGAMGMGTVSPFEAKSNQFWWPDQLDLAPLRDHDSRSNPLGADFNYAMAVSELDLDQIKADVEAVLTDSQDWWPADWGNYGPLFIRLSWHSAGTYRTLDGRGGGDGGQMRFDPLNSWPDNGNLDKAKRLLWPVKQKYGAALSWGDLMVLAGTVGMESMGFQTYGFAFGRTDEWEPDLVYWGPEVEMLASDREDKDGVLQRPLGATHMGLIYVNPEGPRGVPDPVGSAKNIRLSFGRMAMNDEETVALIAGGHTFGKMHGARKPAECVGAEPAASATENQGLGWINKCGKGHSEDTTTSGLEGAWTQAPTQWTTLYLSNLLDNEWQQTRSPAGAVQWIPVSEAMQKAVPDAHVEGKMNPIVMTTADLALKADPAYRAIIERFRDDPEAYRLAFAKAWYKLTHRDMGPKARYIGDTAPAVDLIWQDPIPAVEYKMVSDRDIRKLKAEILDSDLSVGELVRTAWASAGSFRAGDMRGGANGGRVALMPQKDWPVNNPQELAKVLGTLTEIQAQFNDSSSRQPKISLADLIVLGGAAAVEKAASDAGVEVDVPFVPGRGDATQEQTDVASFSLLEPTADAFRNYFDESRSYRSPTDMLVDRADQLRLTVPEMAVLVGGMRSLGGNSAGVTHGVFTDQLETLNNDFFVELLSMSTTWQKSETAGLYEGVDRATGEVKYTATPVDLIFGSNAELRTVAEVYAYDDAQERFVNDFVAAWTKVMQLDRFDLRHDI
ncbi:MAG: catalase/peroxidase HPI [Pseudomonadota bacterium]